MPFADGGEAGRGANLRATLHLCVPLRSFFLHTSERFIRARRFGGLRSKTLSPAPSPERNDRLANLYPPSDICPYGEAPLVTTCRDTAKSVSFGFLRSRQGSDPRVLGTLSVKENIYSNATRSEMKDPRAGSAAAAADAFALPHHPGHVRHPSQTHPIFISLPLWRQGIYSMAAPVHIIAVRHCKERGSGVSYIKHAGRVRACERG